MPSIAPDVHASREVLYWHPGEPTLHSYPNRNVRRMFCCPRPHIVHELGHRQAAKVPPIR